MSYKSKKNAHFYHHLGAFFYKTQWVNLIDVNFLLQKSLEIFDKISADKIWPKKDKEWKVYPLMPIRVYKLFQKSTQFLLSP